MHSAPHSTRRHAPLYSPLDKRAATKLTIDAFLYALHADPHDHYKSMSICTRDDPPDVLLTRTDNKIVGIEITELVDSKSARSAERPKQNSAHQQPRKIRYNYDPREYTDEEFHAELSAIIARKNTKPFKHFCDKRILVIYSDEPFLRHRTEIIALTKQKPLPSSFFDEIYFMLPPLPNISGDATKNERDRLFMIYRRCTEPTHDHRSALSLRRRISTSHDYR